MIITWINYMQILPELFWQEFMIMANARYPRPIIWKDKNLRYANEEEY